MTFSSSDGWPLNGPKRRRQPRAGDLRAEHERQEQQGDPDRGPRVLVAAQPACPSGRRCRASWRSRCASTSHSELDLAEAERRAADRGHEVLGQALHEQQRDPAEHARPSGSRIWSDRRPARTWARWAVARAHEVDRQPARRRTGASSPVDGQARARRCRRRAATATSASSRASVQRGRGRIGPRIARQLADAAPRRSPASRRVSRARPLEAQADLADPDLVAEAERRRRRRSAGR